MASLHTTGGGAAPSTFDAPAWLADIEANARRFTMAAVAIWESKFSPRSIDAPMFDDGKRTLADLIPDPAALAAFEALDDMRVGRGCYAMEGY